MTNHALGSLLVVLAVSPFVAAQSPSSSVPARPDVDALFSDWRQRHGDDWRIFVDGGTGHMEMIAGGNAAPAYAPRSDQDFVDLARRAIGETYPLHGIELSSLLLQNQLHLPLGIIGSSDKMTVRFQESVNGVPVEHGWVNALFDMRGRLLSVQSSGLPHAVSVSTSPALPFERAAQRAAEALWQKYGMEATTIGVPELVIDQFENDGQRVGRLAWKVDTQFYAEGQNPFGRRWFVDASNGEAYRSEESIHFFDVSGTINSNASPGLLPDIASNPETPQAMRFIKVTSGSTNVFADTNGNFTLPGLTAPVSITVTYTGTYAKSQNSAGASYTLTTTLSSATGNSVLMNPTSTELGTAQANSYRCMNLTRDFIRATNPSDTHGDFLATANVFVSGTCNAYYDGSSLNFFAVGGGCVDSAYTTVVNHENGHWMNDKYSTGNGSDGMGEGNADVWSMYIHDTPTIGADFQGSSSIRSGNNLTHFCGDSNPACYGEVHMDGEPWMGAAWKVRNRLNITNGNTAGDLIANAIFLGWMNGYNQTQIKSIIETQWLTLDDDDGNINNGTPHYTDIDNGFRDQFFPGVTLLAVSVTGVTALADTTDQIHPYTVNATVVANSNPPLVSASLNYRVDGGAFTSVPMTNTGGNNWTGQIPAQLSPLHVEYYVAGTDNSAVVGTFPTSAPNILLDFAVGITHVLRAHNFDTTSDEGWVHGSVGDTSSNTDEWQRGIPNGKTGTGWADPRTAYSVNNCWATDLGTGSSNGSYPANVDMYLRAPATDCTGASNVKLRFKRWLSVQGSASDQATVLVNGNQIWINPVANLNDNAWITQEIPLGAIADNNSSVQVEWRLKSNATTNYGGWNIDDVEIVWIEGVLLPCTAPQNYCVGAPNSIGTGANMSYTGAGNIVGGDFTLYAQNCPANTIGLFFYGLNAVQVPFGNGFRCVGGSVYRLPLVPTDFFGEAHYELNYGALPHAINAGEQWRFQYWYRNPAAGGAGFNLTDGLLVTFCP